MEETGSNPNVVTGGLVANTPYLFIPSVTGDVTFSGSVSSTVAGTTPETSDIDGWVFHGTYESRLWDNTHHQDEIGSIYGFAAQSYTGSGYTVNPGNFVKAASGASIAPFRAYLQYTAPSSARGLTRGAEEELPATMSVRLISASGTTTAIGSLDTRTGEITFGDEWYSLDGRRLGSKPATKGVYINNGKKVVIK